MQNLIGSSHSKKKRNSRIIKLQQSTRLIITQITRKIVRKIVINRGNDNHLCLLQMKSPRAMFYVRILAGPRWAQALSQVNSITKVTRPPRSPSGPPRVHAVKLYSITGVLNIARAVGYERWQLSGGPWTRELERQRRWKERPCALAYGTHNLAHSLYNSVISMLIPPAGSRYFPWWMHGHRRIALFIEIQLKLNSFAALVDLRRG